MINENHIIKFEHDDYLNIRLNINNYIFINDYSSSKDARYVIYIDIHYNNLNIYTSIFSNNRFDYIFNLSNMLYKLHDPSYYRKYNCKELI